MPKLQIDSEEIREKCFNDFIAQVMCMVFDCICVIPIKANESCGHHHSKKKKKEKKKKGRRSDVSFFNLPKFPSLNKQYSFLSFEAIPLNWVFGLYRTFYQANI